MTEERTYRSESAADDVLTRMRTLPKQASHGDLEGLRRVKSVDRERVLAESDDEEEDEFDDELDAEEPLPAKSVTRGSGDLSDLSHNNETSSGDESERRRKSTSPASKRHHKLLKDMMGKSRRRAGGAHPPDDEDDAAWRNSVSALDIHTLAEEALAGAGLFTGSRESTPQKRRPKSGGRRTNSLVQPPEWQEDVISAPSAAIKEEDDDAGEEEVDEPEHVFDLSTAALVSLPDLNSSSLLPGYQSRDNWERAGWLWKRSDFLKKWNKRWVVLSGGVLFYSKEERDDCVVRPRGTILLRGCSLREEKTLRRPNAFSLMHPNRSSHLLAASSEGVMREWVRDINRALKPPVSKVEPEARAPEPSPEAKAEELKMLHANIKRLKAELERSREKLQLVKLKSSDTRSKKTILYNEAKRLRQEETDLMEEAKDLREQAKELATLSHKEHAQHVQLATEVESLYRQLEHAAVQRNASAERDVQQMVGASNQLMGELGLHAQVLLRGAGASQSTARQLAEQLFRDILEERRHTNLMMLEIEKLTNDKLRDFREVGDRIEVNTRTRGVAKPNQED